MRGESGSSGTNHRDRESLAVIPKAWKISQVFVYFAKRSLRITPHYVSPNWSKTADVMDVQWTVPSTLSFRPRNRFLAWRIDTTSALQRRLIPLFYLPPLATPLAAHYLPKTKVYHLRTTCDPISTSQPPALAKATSPLLLKTLDHLCNHESPLASPSGPYCLCLRCPR
jgi:hypothetical protein